MPRPHGMVHLKPALAWGRRAARLRHPLLLFRFLLLPIAPDPDELEDFWSSGRGSSRARAVWIHEHHFPRDLQLQVTVADERERQLVHVIAALDLEGFPIRV